MRMPRHISLLLVSCGLLGYFGFHAVHGRHGLEARKVLHARALRLEQELSGLKAVRAGLAREVQLLSGAQPDPEFIEELARGLFAYARPGDRIVLDGVERTRTQ